jgi:SEC-C motif
MFSYAEMSTAELIDLLFKEEDRVKRGHIEELVRRGEEAAGPLREIIKNEDYWYEGQDGDYWIVIHAITVLSAIRDEKALPDLIEMVPHAYISNHDNAVEILPAALSQFGQEAAEPYMNFINEHRGAYRDNSDYSFCRNVFSAALTRIALENDQVRERVTGFICNNFIDPQEDDAVFLSLSAAHPLALDRERGLRALREAFKRGVIKEEVTEGFDQFIRFLDSPGADAYYDLKRDLFDFYLPEAIRERQREKAKLQRENLGRDSGGKPVSAGYSLSQRGALVRLEKTGRNDSCPCGSGKKYKKCCGKI